MTSNPAFFGNGAVLVFLLPPITAVFAQKAARFGAWALMIPAFLPMVRLYRAPWWTAPLLPAIAGTCAFLTLDSAVQPWRGRGGGWKGGLQARLERAEP